jgi:hypothetical protein
MSTPKDEALSPIAQKMFDKYGACIIKESTCEHILEDIDKWRAEPKEHCGCVWEEKLLKASYKSMECGGANVVPYLTAYMIIKDVLSEKQSLVKLDEHILYTFLWNNKHTLSGLTNYELAKKAKSFCSKFGTERQLEKLDEDKVINLLNDVQSDSYEDIDYCSNISKQVLAKTIVKRFGKERQGWVDLETNRKVLVEFMGWCSARYAGNADCGLSMEDISVIEKTLNKLTSREETPPTLVPCGYLLVEEDEWNVWQAWKKEIESGKLTSREVVYPEKKQYTATTYSIQKLEIDSYNQAIDDMKKLNELQKKRG